MKRTILCAALLAALAAAVPFLCLLPWGRAGTQVAAVAPSPTVAPTAEPEAGYIAATAETAAVPPPVFVLDDAAGQVVELSAKAYMIGAAACEMPLDWPDDALQAQMVAAYSYALYQGSHGGSAQAGYLTVNSAQCSGWTNNTVLQSRWGADYAANAARLEQLADEVGGAMLQYGGAPAAACYHAISCGRTEASQNVWQEALPYLQGVDSAWDNSSEEYEVTIQYSRQQFCDAVAALGFTPPDGEEPDGWLGNVVWDAAGYVQSMELCGQSFTGTALRRALSLRSACFASAWRGGQFVITTRGYGHGVGLSQYGAKEMAAGGAGWQEILTYYFPGCEVVG